MTHMTDTGLMEILVFFAVPTVVMGALGYLSLRYGAESRPGFNEARPLA